MKRYMKEHKVVVVAVILMFVIIIGAFFVKQAFFSNSHNAVYGHRLDGIDAVKLTKGQKEKIRNGIESDSAAKSATCSLQGRIINIIITVNDDVGLDTAKSLANKVADELDQDQKKYYDIQVFIKKDNDASDFPIIGYKQNGREGFTWTKDRVAA